jgi:hypothetical protein
MLLSTASWTLDLGPWTLQFADDIELAAAEVTRTMVGTVVAFVDDLYD